MEKTKQELKEIKVFAEHYTQPITDIKGFNNLLKENGFNAVRRKTLKKLLNY